MLEMYAREETLHYFVVLQDCARCFGFPCACKDVAQPVPASHVGIGTARHWHSARHECPVLSRARTTPPAKRQPHRLQGQAQHQNKLHFCRMRRGPTQALALPRPARARPRPASPAAPSPPGTRRCSNRGPAAPRLPRPPGSPSAWRPPRPRRRARGRPTHPPCATGSVNRAALWRPSSPDKHR